MNEDPITRIHRVSERAVEDRDQINAILDDGLVCHAAYVIDGRPVVIPMLYARDGDRLLLHGSNASGVVKAVRQGSPISVAVTHVDGMVVARSSFHSSTNYRSVVAHGTGRLLEGEERVRALDAVVDALIPGRRADIREPTDAELKQTGVVALDLDQVSAKVRTGPPIDDEEDLETGVWAGVIPLEMKAGTPVPAPDLESGVKTPDYLRSYRR
jgi:nitroimidazol reductase NimA-like FMN-containing flavoprotein (pyridoxamine 5'-phosphate oxidase superfamily)